ncbi:MAG: hypothetical protein GXO39_03905 [Thermotogae bacterium]|nr:hypothetical protein [Thermotogota bacterium]
MGALFNALYMCYVGQGCRSALLQASQSSAEAAFLYRVWEQIPNKKNFAYGYMRILRGDFKISEFKLKSPYDHYVLGVFYEKVGRRKNAAHEYYTTCLKTKGLFAAESCYRAYRLGIDSAKVILKRRFPEHYYLYFVGE